MSAQEFTVNGVHRTTDADPRARLSEVLRNDLGLKGTKVGCDAGDCGACSVIMGAAAVCACLVPAGRLDGEQILTVEGLAQDPIGVALQESFLRHSAAQCGFCTPGMLMAARVLLDQNPHPTYPQVVEALGGVLCRCTGYRKIIEAVADALEEHLPSPEPVVGKAVGQSIPRVDGRQKVDGSDEFGDDGVPSGALVVRVIRSPYHRAEFALSGLDDFVASADGIEAVISAADINGLNAFGVIPGFVDQPVFAEKETRFMSEAIAAVVGSEESMCTFDQATFPVMWRELPPLLTINDTLETAADPVHEAASDHTLVRGVVQRGAVDDELAGAAFTAEGSFETSFVEHAPIEPEAGWAEVDDDGFLSIHATTQAPHMDLHATAAILGLDVHQLRIVPTAVGGGFGTKLDLSVQPILGLAALKLGRTVRLAYTRPESIATTTKRHPASMTARVGVDGHGDLTAIDFVGEFNTGAYASWGPTVTNRVPVHAGGPYRYPAYRARTRAVFTNCVPSGAFRGFGVPQAAIAQESVFDELADRVGIDRLEFRIRNALRAGDPTSTGQVFESGVGFRECLELLRDPWAEALERVKEANSANNAMSHGVGVAGLWYGCGNTALPNPALSKIGVRADGTVVMHQGAVDIGQGSNTVLVQIAADALEIDYREIQQVGADTSLTPDAGKTSASRQTLVSGNAVRLAAENLRGQLDQAGDLAALPADADGYVLVAVESWDPPTTPLDENGQGDPYAVYGFGAQMVELRVDSETGRCNLDQVLAAYDVGRAINPLLIEGQVEGGVAQGIGMALMEEFVPGANANLHDYLIPTIGDIPEIRTTLVESDDPIGPFGAKGIGEHTLIPTAPAILNAIRHATGATVRQTPATPERVLRAIMGGQS